MANLRRVVVAHSATDSTPGACNRSAPKYHHTENSTRHAIRNRHRSAGKPSASTVGSGIDAAAVVTHGSRTFNRPNGRLSQHTDSVRASNPRSSSRRNRERLRTPGATGTFPDLAQQLVRQVTTVFRKARSYRATQPIVVRTSRAHRSEQRKARLTDAAPAPPPRTKSRREGAAPGKFACARGAASARGASPHLKFIVRPTARLKSNVTQCSETSCTRAYIAVPVRRAPRL